ncbi:MAG: hypothetical protein LW728_22560 [Microcystis sp. 49638_E5]|jgi:hypothetical protein|uniref:hypothetical protein n=1 Tax=Microcystis sp. 49638_E5 TaxID=2904986 RepID=UPI00258BABA2|nr:hypothetical protein [Microcystis sp. 49638_E5]MCE2671921.1 hypothetical protein [Microcystis sp. 49638_E5]
MISIEGIGVTPRDIQDLYDRITAAPKLPLCPSLYSSLYNEKLTEVFCHHEDGDFLIVYEKNCYFFRKKGALWDWDIKLIGRPEVIIEDEQIRDVLEEEIPDVNWVLVNIDFNDDECNSQTPFQSHFFDRINIIIDTAYANLK